MVRAALVLFDACQDFIRRVLSQFRHLHVVRERAVQGKSIISTTVHPAALHEAALVERRVIMNGMSGSFPPPGAAWQEHRTPDGRSYYYNSATKVTQWTKPEDLMTPAEVCRPKWLHICADAC